GCPGRSQPLCRLISLEGGRSGSARRRRASERDDGMTRSGLRGWESPQRQTALGAVESEQRVRLLRPVVDDSVDGAQRLGSAYWREVERFTFGLVRSRQDLHGVELRLLGRRPIL